MIDPEILEALRCMEGTYCLICGEHTRYEKGEHGLKICDKCKAAVLKMREHLEHDPSEPILD